MWFLTPGVLLKNSLTHTSLLESFSSGKDLDKLANFYASIIHENVRGEFMLFGPSYKGIPIVTATAVSLYHRFGKTVPYSFSRKEEKDHAEGGRIVGTPLAGRVVIVDDFIETGTAIDESVRMIRQAGC